MSAFRNRPKPHRAKSAQLGHPSPVEWNRKTPVPAIERPTDAEKWEAFEKAVMPPPDEND